ncbi:MAG: hypothetical protein ABWY93_33605 [Mycobacterium sp.]
MNPNDAVSLPKALIRVLETQDATLAERIVASDNDTVTASAGLSAEIDDRTISGGLPGLFDHPDAPMLTG